MAALHQQLLHRIYYNHVAKQNGQMAAATVAYRQSEAGTASLSLGGKPWRVAAVEVLNPNLLVDSGLDTALAGALAKLKQSTTYNDLKGRQHRCIEKANTLADTTLARLLYERRNDYCCYEYSLLVRSLLNSLGYTQNKIVLLKSHGLNTFTDGKASYIVDLTYGFVIRGDFFAAEDFDYVWYLHDVENQESRSFSLNKSKLINQLADSRERRRLFRKTV